MLNQSVNVISFIYVYINTLGLQHLSEFISTKFVEAVTTVLAVFAVILSKTGSVSIFQRRSIPTSYLMPF